MLNYISTKGEGKPVDFETAVLKGFADDGGMFVPERIPTISQEHLKKWAKLSFNELAFELLSLFIDKSLIPSNDLKKLIKTSTDTFNHPDIVPVVPLDIQSNHFVMELFHGPTLSFKDIAMSFLINIMDYFLTRKDERISLLLATTGDTGPAAAYASCGKKTIDCWPLFPEGFISEEQAKQMTTLHEDNIHPIAVENCESGGDDLDVVIAKIFKDTALVKALKISSVNSINWCRVMFQSIHYFYGYFQVVKNIGEEIVFSVPTGAFGNLFAGYLAKQIGLPVKSFICANNSNATIHRTFKTGVFSKQKLKKTPSNAIDIVLPYNFWRFLYFIADQDSEKLSIWMKEYEKNGYVELSDEIMTDIKKDFTSISISNEDTLSTILKTYEGASNYLLDPHGAVAVAAVNSLKLKFHNTKIISLLTAHPAKFPNVMQQALQCSQADLPLVAEHDSIKKMKKKPDDIQRFNCSTLYEELVNSMTNT